METSIFHVGDLTIQTYNTGYSSNLTYILSYDKLPDDAIKTLAVTHDTAVAVVSGIDWDNDLTPWRAPGQPEGNPEFGGNAQNFYALLVGDVLPATESKLGMHEPERTLVGVSLSGLFAVWAWVKDNTPFTNVASISGSFWYPDFTEWLGKQRMGNFPGIAYFSLGLLEPETKVKAFRSVGLRTQEVIAILKAHGAKVLFQQNPGDHFAPVMPRLARALTALLPIPA